jgi:hypothetical protein
MNKKAQQFGILSVIMGVIAIVGYVALLPLLNSVISDALPYMDSWTTIIVTLLPLIIALMIVVGIVNGNSQRQMA